jgi:hypothetical protein
MHLTKSAFSLVTRFTPQLRVILMVQYETCSLKYPHQQRGHSRLHAHTARAVCRQCSWCIMMENTHTHTHTPCHTNTHTHTHIRTQHTHTHTHTHTHGNDASVGRHIPMRMGRRAFSLASRTSSAAPSMSCAHTPSAIDQPKTRAEAIATERQSRRRVSG